MFRFDREFFKPFTVSPNMSKLFKKISVCALFAFSAAAAMSQTYPNKGLRFIVPFPAGSATDNVGRIVGQAMSDALGQPVAVENKAGANGILGAEVVKAAVGDPYTFLVTTNTTQAASSRRCGAGDHHTTQSNTAQVQRLTKTWEP